MEINGQDIDVVSPVEALSRALICKLPSPSPCSPTTGDYSLRSAGESLEVQFCCMQQPELIALIFLHL
jgi:hypothetical protein